MEENNKIEIVIDEHMKLVAWKDTVSDYNEISVYLEKDGYIYQDLALVRQKYEYNDEAIKNVPGKYEVIVWANCDDEDYTNKYEVEEHVEPEE